MDKTPRGILLDSSFLMRLLNDEDQLHDNALRYFRYFLENGFVLKCSTIAVAEYCVRGQADELPMANLKILPFNFDHAIRAGELAQHVFAHKNQLNLPNRTIIPNDSKLFAQADVDTEVSDFATSDVECIKIYTLLKQQFPLNFNIINVRNPWHETFGQLDLT